MTLRYLTLGILGLLLYPGLGAANAIRSNEGEPDRRTPLRHVAKTGGRTSFDGLTSRVIVKFREGTPRHVVDSALGKRASDSAASMAIAEEALAVVPTFWRSPEELQAEEARLESSSEIDLADLSLYLDVRTASPERAERLARRLESFDEIEVAYVQATPLPPGAYASHVDHSEISKAAAPLAVTPDFTGTQFYLGTAPGGFGIKAMRNEPGGRGQGIRVLDIQYSWNVIGVWQRFVRKTAIST